MKYSLTFASSNRKVGPIPVSYSGAQTCPDSCPLKGNGCYAELGPGAAHWKRLTSGTRGVEWFDFINDVKSIPKGYVWRHNVAGDLPGVNEEIDHRMLYELVDANHGRRGFTYTHKPMTLKNQHAVRMANEMGFTINLSADNLHEADELMALGVGPVVVVLPSDAPFRQVTPAGHDVIRCPAEDRDDVTCASCQVCAYAERKSIIGFRAHGSRKKKVNIIVRSV